MVMHFENGEIIYHVELNSMVDAHNKNGVLSGFGVTAQSTPNMSVQCAGGQCYVNNELYNRTTGYPINIMASDPNNPRIDLIYFNISNQFILIINGSPAVAPKPPEVPSNCILLALIHVPAGYMTIENDQIVDGRVTIKPVGLEYVLSDNLVAFNDVENYHSITTYTKVKELIMPNTVYSDKSELRVSFEMKSHADGVSVYGRIYRNGSAIGNLIAASSTIYDLKSEDSDTWSAGDLIQLWTHCGGAGRTVYIKNFRIHGDLEPISIYGW